MNNLHRIFVAVNLPEKLRNELNAFQNQWLDLPAKWARPENLHITLSFLGTTNDQELVDICSLVAKVAKRHEPFEVALNRICYGPLKNLPDGKPPRMVWVVGEKSEFLGSLHRDLENILHEFAGADSDNPEGYNFSPHITLARIMQAGIKRMEIEEIPFIDETIKKTFSVESIEIMESESKRGGQSFTILESVKLGD